MFVESVFWFLVFSSVTAVVVGSIMPIKNTLPPTYKIRDDKVELEGSFYQEELQETHEDTFRIEKVLKWKKKDGVRIARVKWVGYDNSYNSWVPESDIINYGNN